MPPGGELHPDLMGPPGVESDVRKAQCSVRGGDAVFEHGFPHPFARAADREDPALPAVLEQIVPQDAVFRQRFVRCPGKDGPVLLGEDRCGQRILGGCSPAVQHGVGFLALGDLPCQRGGGFRSPGTDHQAGHAGVQPVHDAHIGVRLPPQLPQPGGQAGLTGQAGRFVHDHKGRILIEDHSLPSSSRAFSLSTPATVLPSLISPLMTIS